MPSKTVSMAKQPSHGEWDSSGTELFILLLLYHRPRDPSAPLAPLNFDRVFFSSLEVWRITDTCLSRVWRVAFVTWLFANIIMNRAIPHPSFIGEQSKRQALNWNYLEQEDKHHLSVFHSLWIFISRRGSVFCHSIRIAMSNGKQGSALRSQSSSLIVGSCFIIWLPRSLQFQRSHFPIFPNFCLPFQRERERERERERVCIRISSVRAAAESGIRPIKRNKRKSFLRNWPLPQMWNIVGYGNQRDLCLVSGVNHCSQFVKKALVVCFGRRRTRSTLERTRVYQHSIYGSKKITIVPLPNLRNHQPKWRRFVILSSGRDWMRGS